MSPQFYLRPDVAAEPLFNQWVAWPYLMPPASAALFLERAHLPTLRSYLREPAAHLERAQAKKISLGDPTIAYPELRVDAVRALLARTEADNAELRELAQAIRELEALIDTADGMSLEALYARVPAPLAGMVELTYDLRHRASYRLIEALLYRSPYFKRSAHSVLLHPLHSDDRLTVLGTPRLEVAGGVEVRIAFDDPALDALFAARWTPVDPNALAERLAIAPEARKAFGELFTTEAPAPAPRFTGPGMRMRYFGHACVLLESEQSTVLVDPLLSYRNPSGPPRFDLLDLPERIDAVVITHGHEDHLHLETLLQLRGRIGTILVPRAGGGSLHDPSLKLLLEALGFRRVVELNELDSFSLPDGRVTAMPFFGEHGDLDVRAKAAFFVSLAESRAAFVADSNNFEPRAYRRVAEQLGGADMLFVGMECDGSPLPALYGPLFPQPVPEPVAQSRRYNGSDSPRALDLVDTFSPKHVFVYAMGQEPWLYHIMNIQYTQASRPIVESNRLIAACRERKIEGEQLFCQRELTLDARPRPVLAAG